MGRRIILLWTLAVLLMAQTVAYAVPHNWQWIESDDEFGYFVDTANINTTSNTNGKVRYAELWLKMKYTSKSAADVLKDFEHSYVNADLLADDGMGIFKIKLDFVRGAVHVLSSSFLDKNGNILAKDTDDFYQYVDVQTFYRPVFTYVANQLADTNDYAMYKDKKNRRFVYKKKNGDNTEYTWVNLWRAHYANNDESKVFVPVCTYTRDVNNETIKTDCAYWCYDLNNNNFFIAAMLYEDNNDDWVYYDCKEHNNISKPTAVVPDTLGETIAKAVKSFAMDNKGFLHRLDDDGITVKR